MSAFHDEGQRLRALACSQNVRHKWRDHALKEMAKDHIGKLDVTSMLKRCRVVAVEQNRFEEVWTAEGGDLDGNQITAIVVAYEERMTIKVITAWRRRR